MPRPLEWALYILSFILIINASLVLYNTSTTRSYSVHTENAAPQTNQYKHQATASPQSRITGTTNHNTTVSHSGPPQCCNSCIRTSNGQDDSMGDRYHQWKKEVNYQELTTAMPRLNPDYYTNSLTRLGSDLNFDRSSCPSSSVMLQHNSNFTPLHLDCPTLFIVGARKAGTSSLYQYVTKHPDFEGTRLDRGPQVGETYYFSSHYKSSWSQYIQLFPSDGVMTGDASVGNLVECNVPKRLFESCGKRAKVVMMFRDPVDRFVSNFLMRAKYGTARVHNSTSITTFVKLHLDNFFHKALARSLDVTRMPQSWSKLQCLFSPAINVVYEGLYYVHLLNWICNFPPENILVLNSEEFYQKPSSILAQVFQFLGLKELKTDTLDWITSNVYNKGSYSVPSYQKILTVDKKKLLGVYEPFNKALFEVLDWQKVKWNK